MIHFADWLGHWSVDVYLLGSVLLILALIVTAVLRQPVHRLTITKSLFIALTLLAALCAVPGWSALHLLTAKPPAPSESIQPVSPRITPADITGEMQVTKQPPTIPTLAAPPTPVPTLSRTNISAWEFAGAIEFLGALAVTIWLATGSAAARTLRRKSQEAPLQIQELLQQITKASPSKHAPPTKILISNRINVPVALGLYRPKIILPADSPLPFREGPGEGSSSHIQLRTILAHELAHIQNHDLHWIALSRLLLIIFWPQPLFWFARRHMRLDQESLADAAAADLTTREKYAEQLVAWARNLTNTYPTRLASAVGLWEGASQLRQRIALLLDERFALIRQCSRRTSVAVTTLALVAALVLSMVTVKPAQTAPPSAPNNASQPTSSSSSLGEFNALQLTRTTPNQLVGKVVDAKQQPLADVEISVFRVRQSDSSRKLLTTLMTGKNGEYHADNFIDLATEFADGKFPQFHYLRDDYLQVVGKAPGFASQSQVTTISDIVKNGESMPMVLQRAVTVRGKVSDSGGKSIAGASVSIDADGNFWNWPAVSSVETDAAGNYVIEDANPFDLAASENGFKDPLLDQLGGMPTQPALKITHTSFATKQVVLLKAPGTQDITLEALATLTGRVVYGDSGKPASDVLVQARSRGGAPPVASDSRLPPIVQTAAARTNADGNYKIETLPGGRYELWAEAENWTNLGAVISAESGTPNRMPDLTLTKGGVISARLVDEDTGKPIPIKNDTTAMIAASPMPFDSSGPTVMRPAIPVTADGRFELRSAPGKKSARAVGVNESTTRNWFGKKFVEVQVVEGQTVQVDLPAKELTGSPWQKIDSVYASENQPPAGPFKSVSPAPAPPPPGAVPVANPAPLLPTAAPPASATKRTSNTSEDTSGTPAKSHTSQAKHSSRRPRPNSISGQVTNEENQPLANATVSIFHINNKTGERVLLKSASTNDKGQFTAEDVLDLKKEFPNGKLPSLDDFSGALLQIFIQAPGRATYSWLQSPQLVARWGDMQAVTLEAAAPLRGRVLTSDSKPVAGAMVSVGQSVTNLGFGWEGAQSTRTDADGNYTISDVGPFDLQKYRDEREAAAKQSLNAKESLRASRYLVPPKLTVEHPDYAVKQSDIDKIPGTKDVKLDPAAVITGRVIYAESGKPAAGALVHAGGNLQRFTSDADISVRDGAVQVHYRYPSFTSSARTDANGNYRFNSLPVGYYRVWADLPGWQSADVGDVAARSGTTQSAPDVKFIKGGTLSVNLKDSKTDKPLQMEPGTTATLGVQPGPGSNRPIIQQSVTINADGRFELQLPPGEATVFVGSVAAGDDVKWIGTSGEANSRTLVTIEDEKTTKLELPVIDLKSAQITGTFQVAPAEEPKAASPSAQ